MVFMGILILVMIYSRLYSENKPWLQVPSGSLIYKGHPSLSKGLSRSFAAIMRFQFRDAKNYNPHGIRIFLFFFIQLWMRIGALLLCNHVPGRSLSILYWTDSILSVILFLVTFWPFLTGVVNAVSKT
jgi:hypothetical protein